MLEVTFNMTTEDSVAFVEFSTKRAPSYRLRFFKGWLVMVLGFWVLAGAAVLSGSHWWFPTVLATCGAVMAVMYPSYYRKSVNDSTRAYCEDVEGKGHVGRLTLTLTDEGLRTKGEVTEVSARWEKMTGVAEDTDHTFVFISGTFVVIVPRHGIPDPATYAAVRDFIFSKLKPMP